MATKKQVTIREWKTVGGQDNFTVLGLETITKSTIGKIRNGMNSNA